jgi:hypothetical protein
MEIWGINVNPYDCNKLTIEWEEGEVLRWSIGGYLCTVSEDEQQVKHSAEPVWFLLLKHIYSLTKGCENYIVPTASLGTLINWDDKIIKSNIEYLLDEKLLKRPSVGDSISISQQGVEKVEAAKYRASQFGIAWQSTVK